MYIFYPDNEKVSFSFKNDENSIHAVLYEILLFLMNSGDVILTFILCYLRILSDVQ